MLLDAVLELLLGLGLADLAHRFLAREAEGVGEATGEVGHQLGAAQRRDEGDQVGAGSGFHRSAMSVAAAVTSWSSKRPVSVRPLRTRVPHPPSPQTARARPVSGRRSALIAPFTGSRAGLDGDDR